MNGSGQPGDTVAAANPGPPDERWRWPRSAALALALLVVAGGTLSVLWARAYPVATPTPTAVSDDDALPASTIRIGDRQAEGLVLTLRDAAALTGYDVPAPTLPEFGQPTAVFLDDRAPGRPLVLVYHASAGRAGGDAGEVRVVLVRGSLAEATLAARVASEPVSINGRPGRWLAAPPPALPFRDVGGAPRETRLHRPGGVLVWQVGPALARIEGAGSRDEALRIAASMR